MCYMWHEGETEKGSSEIATALQQYTDQAVKAEKNILHFFADRCGGQNNNRMVSLLSMRCLSRTQLKKSV